RPPGGGSMIQPGNESPPATVSTSCTRRSFFRRGEERRSFDDSGAASPTPSGSSRGGSGAPSAGAWVLEFSGGRESSGIAASRGRGSGRGQYVAHKKRRTGPRGRQGSQPDVGCHAHGSAWAWVDVPHAHVKPWAWHSEITERFRCP